MEGIITLIRAVLLLAIMVAIYDLQQYISANKAIQRTKDGIIKTADERYTKRKDEKEKIYLEEGNTDNKSFFYNLDLLIERSGLRKKHEFLTTEIYLLIVVLISLLFFTIGYIFGGIIFGTLGVTISTVASYGILYIKAGVNYEKVESQIVPFVNLLENYSSTDGDIVNIMGNIYPYLEAPLSEYVETFYNEAKNSGDYTRAFMNFKNSVESMRLRSIINNLEAASRNEANYDEIIKDERRSLKNYSKAKARREAITSNGRKQIVTSLIMSGILIKMFMSFAPGLFKDLLFTSTGNLILVYCIIVIGYCSWKFIAFDKGDKV